MTSVNDISMFDSNFGHQPASSRPHLDDIEDYSFAFDPAHGATSCSHRALQEVLNRENPMATMTNISKGHTEQIQASQTNTASSSDTEVERLKRDVLELRKESGARAERIEKLYEMLHSLVITVAQQGVAVGVAIKQMIGEMSPDRSETFSRGLREELHKLPIK